RPAGYEPPPYSRPESPTMIRLLTSYRLELNKIFRQRGTYVSYAILAIVSSLMVWGMWRYGFGEHLKHSFGREMVVGGRLVTAQTVAGHIMEPVFIVLVPALIAMIVSSLIAAESKSGVLRTWLCRPLSRSSLYTAKSLAAGTHAILLTFFLGLFTLLLGYIFFGGGDLVDMSHGGRGMVILDEAMALQRLGLAYGLAALLMCGMGALALLASVIFENPLVAAGAAVAFIPISGIIQSLEYFECLKPYLLTNYLDAWKYAFKAQLELADFLPALYCVVGYCLVPYVLGLIIFRQKDIVS
ncbi:MAG: ABC transporter permease subunit, partial [Armatimonadia bacterium]